MNISQPAPATLLIGLGTGRCGTQSLAHLLNRQHNAEVYHERQHHAVGWQNGERQIDELLDWVATKTNRRLVGDVALYYLPYVEYILERQPSAKFFCLQRDCMATVLSYLQQTPQTNHWVEHQGVGWQLDPWDHCYPKYALAEKRNALTRYWLNYYAQAEVLQSRYPNSLRIFSTDSLNSEAGQRAILTFAGIPSAKMRLDIGLRRNTGRHKQWLRLGTMMLGTTGQAAQSLKQRLGFVLSLAK